ncbi:response regulator [Anabaena sp. UHCC 0253]|uniref:response regulator n=1 Tax=Anabaena sp. UHCC 0253 TaxID=2590019 RepID=UPI0014472936|nr:response regulator [Anabaena sp. UHCC 0253]MTJ51593.1 response regulator [Anabaena sp. UHCC 0253]
MVNEKAEFINIITAENPDLILIDMPIQSIDKLEIIPYIRANQQFQHIPIIVLAAATPSDINNMDSSHREKCIAVGVNEYFTKPVKLKIILDKIQTLLTQS